MQDQQRSKPSPANSLLDQILSNLPPETAQSFTPNQLDDLRAAFRQVSWKKHALDVRFTLPFPRRGTYVVLLAGAEQRSPERLRAQRASSKSGVMTSTVICTLVLGAMATLSLLQFLRPMMASITTEAHPTAIPWLQTKVSCEETGRTWHNGACWDALHDPDF